MTAVRFSRRLLAGIALLALGGCASTAIEQNFSEAQQLTQDRFGTELKWLRTDDARREAREQVDATLAAAAVPHVAAQTAPAAPPPAAASVAPASGPHRSAFEGYRPFAEQPVGSWREANDTVGRIAVSPAAAHEGHGGGTAGAKAGAVALPAGHGSMPMPSGAGSVVPPRLAASSPARSLAPVKLTPAGAAPASTPSGHAGHRAP